MKRGNYKHGHFGTPTYKSWSEMKYRCKKVGKKYWHGRGIRVCGEWKKFENFLKDMGERPAGKTLDRIDNSMGYYRENCRWATNKQQQNNKRTVHLFRYKGKRKTLIEWSKIVGVKRSTLAQRYYGYGWSVARTLSTK